MGKCLINKKGSISSLSGQLKLENKVYTSIQEVNRTESWTCTEAGVYLVLRVAKCFTASSTLTLTTTGTMIADSGTLLNTSLSASESWLGWRFGIMKMAADNTVTSTGSYGSHWQCSYFFVFKIN